MNTRFRTKHLYRLSLLLAIAVGAVAVAIQTVAAFDGSSGGSNVVTKVEANLAGASLNGAVPRGEAEFVLFTDGNRKFEAKVSNTNLPDGTVLNVFVDQANVGRLRVVGLLGKLELETKDGQTVPPINSRTRVVISDLGGLTIVAGSFSNIPAPGATPTPSPGATPSPSPGATPSPTPSPNPSPNPTPNPGSESRIESRLAGAAINGLTPKGHARFETRSDGRRKLNVEVERVRLPVGTILGVFVDGNKVGEFALNAMLENELELDTRRGSVVPVVTSTSTVVVTDANGNTILSGAFNTSSNLIAGNDIDDTNFFVEQHYRDFLDREADDSGLDFWKGQIANCADDSDCRERARINTSGAFFLSIEFQETGFMLYRFNKLAFGVMPRRNDFLVEVQLTASGLVVGQEGWQDRLEQNKREAAGRWVASAAFQSSFGSLSNQDYVNQLFANAGVSGNTAERQSLIQGLNSGAETRATVLRKIADNGGFRQRETNPAFVLMQYFGYLHRNPDEGPDSDLSGFNFWLNKLNENSGDFHQAEMVKAFLRSGEYRDRFLW
jgi:hypothetical protein